MVDDSRGPLVAVLMGSDSDLPVMEEALNVLDTHGVSYEAKILSAHRCPEETARYASEAAGRGIQVVIAGAGWAAHLAGVVASKTTLPVIGVPIDSSPLSGMDALLSTVQMPPGIPVATMAIGKGGARNAAVFALQILALRDSALAERLERSKKDMAEDVFLRKNLRLQEQLASRRVR